MHFRMSFVTQRDRFRLMEWTMGMVAYAGHRTHSFLQYLLSEEHELERSSYYSERTTYQLELRLSSSALDLLSRAPAFLAQRSTNYVELPPF